MVSFFYSRDSMKFLTVVGKSLSMSAFVWTQTNLLQTDGRSEKRTEISSSLSRISGLTCDKHAGGN